MSWLFFIVSMLASWLMTLFVVKLAPKLSLMDVPNERSSHSQVIPRSGGIGIIVTYVVALSFFVTGSDVHHSVLFGVVTLGVTGLLDDKFGVSAYLRLVVHVLVCAVLVFNEIPPLDLELSGYEVELEIAGRLFIVVILVWFINLFNFMDGIDGIASKETLFVAFALLFFVGMEQEYSKDYLVLSGAVLGFLYWNWSPARIFMGDVSSGALGFMIGAFIFLEGVENTSLLWCGFILAGYFIVDSSYTLLIRLIAGKKIYQAHRTHGYQKLAIKWNSHLKTTSLVMAINVGWLFPLSYAVYEHWLHGSVALLMAYAPIVMLNVWLRAGKD